MEKPLLPNSIFFNNFFVETITIYLKSFYHQENKHPVYHIDQEEVFFFNLFLLNVNCMLIFD